ncbi:MAG: YraN family protein [Treponema sp.]|jgi:putative endonuclease|nr:YraN family protein [Treponema sp.]
MNTKTKGDAGEDRAALYLEEKGFKIIARKWRTRSGEIDIIAEKDDYLVFFEVKTLPKGTNDMLLRELNQEKQQRILKTSKRFLLNHRQYNDSYIRFDVIVIDMPGYPPVYHIENAFME